MPIAVTCPECRSQFRVADTHLGKKVRCRGCTAIIAVGHTTHDEEPVSDRPIPVKIDPSRPTRTNVVDVDAADDDPIERLSPHRPRRKSERRTSPIIWIISGSLGAVALALLVVLIVILSRSGAGGDAKQGPENNPAMAAAGAPKQGADNKVDGAGAGNAGAGNAGAGNAAPGGAAAGGDAKQAIPTAEELGLKMQLEQSLKIPTAPELPAAKTVDFSGLRVVSAEGAPLGGIDPDPEEKFSLDGFLFPLSVKLAHVHLLTFSRPSVAQAACVYRLNSGREETTLHVERLDLVGRKSLGSCKLFTDLQSRAVIASSHRFENDDEADLSPDGTRLVMLARGKRRLDVFSLADGRSLAGWIPYEREPFAQFVTWCGFVDDQSLLTLNATGKLILWQVPECRPVYQINLVQGPPALSGQRRHMLVATGGALAVFDPKTGQCRGLLDTDKELIGQFKAACFSRDGQQATVLHARDLWFLTRWDLKTGVSRDTIDAPQAARLSYTSSGHLLAATNGGVKLIDWNLKAPLYHYLNGPVAKGSPDGRFWLAGGSLKKAANLKAITLPDDRAAKGLEEWNKGGGQKSVAAGMSVKLQVRSTNFDFQEEALDILRQRLRQNRLREGDGGLTLSVNVVEQKGTRVFDFKQGFGQGSVKVPEEIVVMSSVLTDGDGVEIGRLDHRLQLPFVPPYWQSPDPARDIRALIWREARLQVGRIPDGEGLYRIGGKLRRWPSSGIVR